MTALKGALIMLTSFAVIFALRALPFVLMSRSKGDGRWFRAAEKWLSPVVIAALVVYSFSTLSADCGSWQSWKPYAGAAVTIAFQLLWRNGLVSIFAGTALYMALARL